MTDNTATEEDQHECQRKGIGLEEGQEVLFNDRSRPLTVIGKHSRQNTSKTRRRRGEAKYHTVVRLEGNGTEYHLLCTSGSTHGPILYKEGDWDENESDKLGNSPRYSRGGERIESIEVVGAEDVDAGEYWQIDEINAESEIYVFSGKGGPPATKAVAKAKQKFAKDRDIEFRHTVGKKISTAPGLSGGAIVVVVHRPKMAANEVLR